MIVDMKIANGSEALGTMSLAHSLLRSRQIWLTRAFEALSDTDYDQPRALISAAEVQIGPHIFTNTQFYRITQPQPKSEQPTKNSSAIPLPPPLVFEFGDNPGDLFYLPKDFSVDRKYTGDDRVLAYFYASPTRPIECVPSIIKQEWPHYFLAERNLVRVNFVLREAKQCLVDVLLEYSDAQQTAVCREYRRALCQPHPTAKYCDEYFSESRGSNSQQPEQVRIPSILKPQSQSTSQLQITPQSQITSRLQSQSQYQPQPQTSVAKVDLVRAQSTPQIATAHMGYPRGGKGGYNMAMAAASWRNKAESSSKSESESESDSEELAATHTPATTAIPARLPIKRSISDGQNLSVKMRQTVLSPVGRGRTCKYCGCNETPIWRRGPAGTGTLCNACGVKWKLGKILQ